MTVSSSERWEDLEVDYSTETLEQDILGEVVTDTEDSMMMTILLDHTISNPPTMTMIKMLLKSMKNLMEKIILPMGRSSQESPS